MNKGILLAVLFLQAILSAGCGAVGEVGYSPPIIPVRISINTMGEINVGLSHEFCTPIGTFDLSLGGTVYSLRNQYDNRVLIVRVDNQAVVYELVAGQEFRVEFDDNNTLYKKVALEYESDGDIVLELESVQGAGENADMSGSSAGDGSSSSNNTSSCPGAPPQRVVVGEKAYVCTQSDRLIVRSGAGKDSTEIERIYPGAELLILKGPKCADSWSWWRVRTEDGLIGWVAEGGDGVDPYFICPMQ